MKKNILYCADAIALHQESGKLVLVERLGKVKGLALPGGKKDPGEFLSRTIVREMEEETGLTFTPCEVLNTYAEPDRDPRGHYVSTIFIGTATGIPKDEVGKTKVVLLTLEEVLARKSELMFDHECIISDYVNCMK